MDIPLFKQLKRRQHAELAVLQDEVVAVAYAVLKEPVLHGGTAIWRCYGGKRFSEDLDFYCAKLPEGFKEVLAAELGRRGLELARFKQTENTVFARVSNGLAEASLEIALRKPKARTVVRYEKADGSFLDVFSLSPEDLVNEKISAFLGRRFIRDLYDVFHLSGLVRDAGAVKASVKKLLENAPLPVDERNLNALVYSGIVPTSTQMLGVVGRRLLE